MAKVIVDHNSPFLKTIVINKGKIIKIWSNVRVKDHAKEVLDFIKSSK